MSDELAAFLDAYDVHRVQDQRRFYTERTNEYERSARQIAVTSEVLLLLAGLCGVVAASWGDGALWLGIVAAALAALAAAVTAWAGVVGFSANSELYRAAQAGLARLRPARPTDAAAAPEVVKTYFDDVEDILLGEVRTWGQKWSEKADSGATAPPVKPASGSARSSRATP